jgi:hypothetical protein
MPEDIFSDVGPFREGLTNLQRGKLAGYLTKACQSVPDARPAALLLGDPTNPDRRGRALKALNEMGSIPRRQVLAAYQRFTRNAKV